MICKYFVPVCGLSLHFHKSALQIAEILNFVQVQFINIFLYGLCFGCCFVQLKLTNIYLLCSILEVL